MTKFDIALGLLDVLPLVYRDHSGSLHSVLVVVVVVVVVVFVACC
jgi:hypothetical protein